MKNFKALFTVLRKNLRRLFFAILIGVTASSVIGFLYPIQRALDLSSHSLANFNSQAVYVLGSEYESAALPILGAKDTCLSTTWSTHFTYKGKMAAPGILYGIGESCPADLTAFPLETRYASAEVANDQWIDLTADTASLLGVKPGQKIEVFNGYSEPPLTLTVRGLYATRPNGGYSGQASASVLFSAMQDSEGKAFTSLWSRLSPNELSTKLDQLAQAGINVSETYHSITSIKDLRTIDDENSSASVGLIKLVSTLALLGGVAIALRELDLFRRKLQLAARLSHQLGGQVDNIMRVWTAVALTTALSSTILGIGASAGVYLMGYLQPTFPHSVISDAIPWLMLSMLSVLISGYLLHWHATKQIVSGK